MNVLVVAAHPDDEVLGCGGTLARLADEGDDVHIGILGEGVTSRFANREEADRSLVENLRANARRAAEILGAKQVLFGDLPDNRFDTIALLDVIKLIEGWIERYTPHVIYTQHGGDLNIDHVYAYRATLTAARPVAGGHVRDIYAYEVGSSTEWAFQQFSPVFAPGVFVDISSTLERKISAMQAYTSETTSFPHPRSPEALRAAAARWGSVAGVRAAEAFQLVRSVR